LIRLKTPLVYLLQNQMRSIGLYPMQKIIFWILILFQNKKGSVKICYPNKNK
jgi:hypothetical protein